MNVILVRVCDSGQGIFFISDFGVERSIYLGEFFYGLLQMLSSNLSVFQTFLAAAFYQSLAVSQSLSAQILTQTLSRTRRRTREFLH